MNKVNKKIFYISTNDSWSGSEELWTRSLKDFYKRGYSVAFITKYKHAELNKLNSKHYIYNNKLAKPIIKKIAAKFSNRLLKENNFISSILKKEKPDLLIISQGNNIDYDGIMDCCNNLKIPYITITNLVTEVHFLSINNDNLYTLQQGYLKALKNYFVSQKNLELNNLMLSINADNAEVVYVPCVINEDEIAPFPKEKNIYKIALIGRIECFHKGYDLLLQLAIDEKWKSRSVHFNIHGDGPHRELLKQNISRLNIKNVFLKGYEKSAVVWKENHILFMPSRMEGTALTLVEAMYCKRAAIVTDVGDAAILIDDNINGFVAPYANVQALDEALERAWENRDLWEESGKKAFKKLKQKYSENAVDFFNEKVLNELSKLHNRQVYVVKK